MNLVCISDTHLRPFQIPNGSILVHSGDLTFDGTPEQIIEGFEKLKVALAECTFEHMLFTPGNHDKLFADNLGLAKMIAESYGWKVLHNELMIIGGVSFYGSAVQPEFCNWAFNHDNHYRQLFWQQAPKCDILVTHAPPLGAGDMCMDGRRVGCQYIAEYIREHKPMYNICGHVHWSYGKHKLFDTQVLNSSICDEKYKAVNKPIVIDI